jgi:predicted ribosome quality control (RQC) complex YloA/Tae2 family protein
MRYTPPRYPLLSYLELQHYVKECEKFLIGSDPEDLGARVEKVFAPESASHPQGYFKNEWVLELNTRERSFQLYLSIRPQQCGLLLLQGKSLKPAKGATRSGFDLTLTKLLVGLRLKKMECVPGERVLKLHFSDGALQNYTLYLVLIPAKPDGVLLDSSSSEMLASVRGLETFEMPPARELTPEQIAKIPYRLEWIRTLPEYARLWFDVQSVQALDTRKQRAGSLLNSQEQSFNKKLSSLDEQLKQSTNDPDWNYYGSLLQIHFYAAPKPVDGFYSVMDYEKEQDIKIPADPKLNLKQQLEKFFHLAKRNRTRLSEATERMQSIRTKLAVTEKALAELAAAKTVDEVKVLEGKIGILEGVKGPSSKEQKKVASFSGKQFASKEGLTILCGRNLTENAELTFKVAKGNDIWLHVKGRPGSHTVILLPQKKTASLDTLLDAAHLCIVYSGGKEWGKTEVDYTFRKHVKKIKNQTEVTYTHNKTLSVDIDGERLKRLSGEEK